jgi:hypothetical protein
MSNIKSAIEKLQNLSETSTFDVFVHQVGRKVKFKPMTGKHEKELIRIFSTPLTTFKEISPYIHNLVQELCEDKSIEFSSVEIPNILLNIRRATAGDVYFDDDTKTDINIGDVIERNNLLKFNKDELKTTIVVDFDTTKFEIQLEVPKNIQTERMFYDYIKNISVETINDAIIKTFSVEMAKIVKKIIIDNKNEETFEIIMDEITSVKQKIQILDALPSKVNMEIRESIKKMKKFEQECLTVDGKSIKIN